MIIAVSFTPEMTSMTNMDVPIATTKPIASTPTFTAAGASVAGGGGRAVNAERT